MPTIPTTICCCSCCRDFVIDVGGIRAALVTEMRVHSQTMMEDAMLLANIVIHINPTNHEYLDSFDPMRRTFQVIRLFHYFFLYAVYEVFRSSWIARGAPPRFRNPPRRGIWIQGQERPATWSVFLHALPPCLTTASTVVGLRGLLFHFYLYL